MHIYYECENNIRFFSAYILLLPLHCHTTDTFLSYDYHTFTLLLSLFFAPLLQFYVSIFVSSLPERTVVAALCIFIRLLDSCRHLQAALNLIMLLCYRLIASFLNKCAFHTNYLLSLTYQSSHFICVCVRFATKGTDVVYSYVTGRCAEWAASTDGITPVTLLPLKSVLPLLFGEEYRPAYGPGAAA